jgi:threonyl-tRNA synthetase
MPVNKCATWRSRSWSIAIPPNITEIGGDWKKLGVRVEVDTNAETLGNKIRKASALKVPYQIAFGQKEADGADLQIRVRGQEKQVMIKTDTFETSLQKIISQRLIDLSL